MKCIAIYPEGEFYTLLIFCSKGKKIQIPIMLSFTKKEIMTSEMQNIFSKYGNAIIGSALPAGEVWWTRVRMPIDNITNREKAITIQLQTLFPHCLDKLLFNFIYTKNKEALIFSILKYKLKEFLLGWEIFSTTPEVVTFAPLTVLKYVNYFYPEQKSFLAINFGRDEVFFISQLDGEIGHIATISIQQSHVDNEKIIKEFDRIFEFFLLKEKKLQDIIFTGNIGVAKKYRKLLEENFKVSFITEKITAVSAKYAIPFGIGLDVCKRDARSLQFCKKNFFSPRSIKLLKQRLYKLSALSIVLSCIVFVWTYSNYRYRKREIQSSFKKEFFRSDTSKSLLVHIEELETELNNSKKKFIWDKEPYKVSKLISYLTTDPKITAQEFKDNIDIIHLTYQLMDVANSISKGEFRTRIQLEFKASSDRLANAFYQAIINSSLLQKKSDITWNKHNDIYCLTFYLI
ncbi:MAG: hypothetical protein ACRCSV_00050 [Chlamydiales bacterium]